VSLLLVYFVELKESKYGVSFFSPNGVRSAKGPEAYN